MAVVAPFWMNAVVSVMFVFQVCSAARASTSYGFIL
jgi:formate-dependent nitrite reductase membrane component NrfD